MAIMNKVMLIAIMLLFFSPLVAGQHAVAEQPTKLKDVLNSSLQYYPSILAAQSDLAGKQALVLAAEGRFDPVISGKAGSRLSGYYDGESLNTQVVQRLPAFNARLFAGYSLADGDFPVYESGSNTLNGGEGRLGFAVSLLRDRDIDSDRAAITDSVLEQAGQAQSLTAEKLEVLREAWIVYAQWLLSARLYESYSELLQIAVDRGEAIQTQIEAGDVAEILQIENQQAVLQRRGLVVEARRQLDMGAEQLSLYLRDSNGEPRYPNYDKSLQMPAEAQSLLAQPIDKVVSLVLDMQPDIRSLELEREQAELKKKLALNSRKPRLDFEYYISRDVGSGPQNLRETDNVAAITFSVPLKNRTATGKEAEAAANIESLTYRISLLRQQLETQVRRAKVNLEATRVKEEIAVEELATSEILANAERQRFDAGLSDFFLLNVRERQIGEAELKRWQAHLQHQVALADFYMATMSLESFAG